MANWEDQIVTLKELIEFLVEKIDKKKNSSGYATFEDSKSASEEVVKEWINYMIEDGFKILRYAYGFSMMRNGTIIQMKDLKRAIKFRKTGLDKQILERSFDDK